MTDEWRWRLCINCKDRGFGMCIKPLIKAIEYMMNYLPTL